MKTKRMVFGVRLDADERQQLDQLARRLRRTRGDALRWLLAQISEELEQGGRELGKIRRTDHGA